jgi:thiamine biosynthesis lipoprotein
MPQQQTKLLQAMGMPFTVIAIDADVAAFQLATQQIDAFLQQVDRDFSPFERDSLVSRYQRDELLPADWTPEFRTVYGLAARAKTVTGGAFDPYFRGVWDPTGVTKGWSIQEAYTRYLTPLLQGGATAVALNGAGDMQMGVTAGSDWHWGVGVENPQDPQRLLYRYELQNAAVATSGFSKRGAHIKITDATHSLVQATILAPTLIEADVWATAALAMGRAAFTRAYHGQALLVDVQQRLITLGGEAVA